jgi:hypothetical protein
VQCDNSGEFRGVLSKLLLKEGIEIVHGRAKHLQSQGSVEQGNGVFKRKLTTWRERNNTTGWVSSLPLLALVMNKQPHSALPNSMCPYEVMFSCEPRCEHRVPSRLGHDSFASVRVRQMVLWYPFAICFVCRMFWPQTNANQ